jgi:hypothetical protein
MFASMRACGEKEIELIQVRSLMEAEIDEKTISEPSMLSLELISAVCAECHLGNLFRR